MSLLQVQGVLLTSVARVVSTGWAQAWSAGLAVGAWSSLTLPLKQVDVHAGHRD